MCGFKRPGSNVRGFKRPGSNIRGFKRPGCSNVRVQMSAGSKIWVQTSGFKCPGFNRPSTIRYRLPLIHI